MTTTNERPPQAQAPEWFAINRDDVERLLCAIALADSHREVMMSDSELDTAKERLDATKIAAAHSRFRSLLKAFIQ